MNEFLETITSRLPEVLTILLSGIISFVCSEFFMRWVFLKIKNRTQDKFSAPIYLEMQKIRTDMKKTQEEQADYIVKLIEQAFEKEAERKKEVYKEITSEEVPQEQEVEEEPIAETPEEVVETEEEKPVDTSLF